MRRGSVRAWASTARTQALTLSGLKKIGFFVRYDYADGVSGRVAPYAELMPHFARHEAAFRALISDMAAHIPAFERFGDVPGDPSWTASMFPPLDGAAAYTIVRQRRPRRVLEIGCGNSTRFMARALADAGEAGELTCVDPAPRVPLEGVRARHVRRMLSDEDAIRCDALEENDILFIDSSHIMLPGMDVDIQFNRMFPRLRRGVLVHLHDVFLPYGYPGRWESRFYSEQNALIGWIYARYFEVLYGGYYAARHCAEAMNEAFAAFLPLMNRSAGSLWLRRT